MNNFKVNIDEGSGCCFGVNRAIEKVEEYLKYHDKLYSLGAIVHNDTEIERLATNGLVTINYTDFHRMEHETILIRAHGEPPRTYQTAHRNNIDLIDCSCPVVLKLQEKIKQTYLDNKDKGGQIVIFGKKGHAEVNGLVGQCNGNATIIEKFEDIDNLVKNADIDIDRPIYLFSQTTKDVNSYSDICDRLSFLTKNIKIYNTICSQVSSRHPMLKKFAAENDLLLFISGKESSNGHALCEFCKSCNPNTYMIQTITDIKKEWIQNINSIGICGATSTPRWQLKKIADYLESLNS
ncbi:MAG: 4-hydroxy-3-methylbut-2-enyl diphosphate reductase [Bacteroidales bacterium]